MYDIKILWYFHTAHKAYIFFSHIRCSHITGFPVKYIFEYFSLKCFGFVKGEDTQVSIYIWSTHEIWAQQPTNVCCQQGRWAHTDRQTGWRSKTKNLQSAFSCWTSNVNAISKRHCQIIIKINMVFSAFISHVRLESCSLRHKPSIVTKYFNLIREVSDLALEWGRLAKYFLYGLFCDIFSAADYMSIAPNGKLRSRRECERKWAWPNWGTILHLPGETEKIYKKN